MYNFQIMSLINQDLWIVQIIPFFLISQSCSEREDWLSHQCFKIRNIIQHIHFAGTASPLEIKYFTIRIIVCNSKLRECSLDVYINLFFLFSFFLYLSLSIFSPVHPFSIFLFTSIFVISIYLSLFPSPLSSPFLISIYLSMPSSLNVSNIFPYSISMSLTSLLFLSPPFHLIQIYAIYNVPAT